MKRLFFVFFMAMCTMMINASNIQNVVVSNAVQSECKKDSTKQCCKKQEAEKKECCKKQEAEKKECCKKQEAEKKECCKKQKAKKKCDGKCEKHAKKTDGTTAATTQKKK